MELPPEMEAVLSKSGIVGHHHQDNDRSSRNSSSGGSQSSDKSRMLDITRDKPIKVAVRVAVPVRDHPKFNFVGKLLGPKGNSMKRLQEETMCKMAVLGRGSMKDRKKEEELRLSGDPRYSHLLADLHVEISTFAAPAEAHARIAYALAEVRRFLVPDYHDDIRQEQMWEMQALSTSQNQSLDSNGSDLLGGSGGSGNTSDHEQSCDSKINNLNNNNNNNNNDDNMQIDDTHNHHHHLATSAILDGTQTTGASAVAAATLLSTTNNGGLASLSAAAAAAAAAHHVAVATNNSTINLTIPNTDIETQTVALVEAPIMHPALRGVKTVNIASGLARKRPLIGVPRSSMNPTKRTVMTLLARAKNAQALHNARSGIPPSIGEPIQMITSPLLLQQSLDVMQHNGNGSVNAIAKENILQGA